MTLPTNHLPHQLITSADINDIAAAVNAIVEPSHAMAYSSTSPWAAYPSPSTIDFSTPTAAGSDITLNGDSHTWEINTDGKYVLGYDVDHSVSASTVKGLLGVELDTSNLDTGNLLRVGNSQNMYTPVDGALIYGVLGSHPHVLATTPPIPFLAGETFTVIGAFTPTGASVGTVSPNLLLTIVRVA